MYQKTLNLLQSKELDPSVDFVESKPNVFVWELKITEGYCITVQVFSSNPSGSSEQDWNKVGGKSVKVVGDHIKISILQLCMP